VKVGLNYIDGSWVPALSGATSQVINPANGEVIGRVPEGDEGDARLAIAAAQKAFYGEGRWRRTGAQNRANIMLRIASAIERRRNEIARLETINNGKPLREAECDIDDAVNCFRYYAGLITKPSGEVYEVNDGFGPMQAFTVREPIGVCAQIVPWNYPFLMAVWKIAPALAAGNSIVFKPSSYTPLSAGVLFEIFNDIGLPPGTVNLVMGSGSTVGTMLAASPDVDVITFTGSTQVGQSIARAAISNLKRVGLELGGKSANVIFADADFEGAVEWAMIGIFFNQGEVCSAGSRIIIEESIKDRFVARLAERARKMTLGNGLNASVDMGPVIAEDHMKKVLGYIEKGTAEGASLVCGGRRAVAGDLARGYFIEPTIFENCTPDMTIVKEEIFGPVVTVQSFRSEEEAIRMANNTIYGLAGGVFTADGARGIRVMRELRAGVTWINCYNPTFNEAPWGGFKMSGYGRELGPRGLDEYTEVKQVSINLRPGILGWYPER
jgi:betaine-aldehyde dehydrogenase